MQHSGAFVESGWDLTEHSQGGSLRNLRFAVKDVFHIRDHYASAGNPDWLATHEAAGAHAPVVQKLLNEAATLVGVTVTDELMFSLNGVNVHYGTPVNPVANDRIPGGSSSGSAVAVANGSVDFALGTDTAGSVRIPASYCGVYGFRPTHNAISLEGVIPLASRFDTVGWFARSASLLENVGAALLPEQEKTMTFATVYVPEEVLELVQPHIAKRFLTELKTLVGEEKLVYTSISEDKLDTYMDTFRTLQGYQIWQTHGEWIESNKPTFADDIAARFQWTSTLPADGQEQAEGTANAIKEKMADLLKEGCLLAIPTSPDVAPHIRTDAALLETHRTNTFKLTAISGLTETPQLTLPLMDVEGLPIGLSLIAGKHMDRALLQFARQVEETFALSL
ncbi:amidase [Shouchella sp. 1P09AA]|uniref:amidase n=1 Tax=unclassified Shouchella TaxID=2893065 RepID=UPI0039A2EB66